MKAGTELGIRARAVMDRGDLVSDEIVLGLIEERLQVEDTAGGFILDGYPRNLAQAASLDALLERIGRPVDIAVQIDIDTERVIARIARRAQEEGRSDDSEETVRNRMEVYQAQTAPVVGHYADKGLLTRVLGDGTIEEVQERIVSILETESAD